MSDSKRAAFALVCIPTRVVAAWVVLRACRASRRTRWLVASGAFAVGAGLMTLYALKLRMHAPEASESGTWWHPLRPVHGALYLAAAGLLAQKNKWAYVPLVVDAAVGALAAANRWTTHR
jgi:hypothetical protein